MGNTGVPTVPGGFRPIDGGTTDVICPEGIRGGAIGAEVTTRIGGKTGVTLHSLHSRIR